MHHTSRFFTLVGLIAMSSVGCGTQIGDEGKPRATPTGTCEPVSTVLAPEDVSPAGFTAASVITGVQGERTTDFSYDSTASTTGLTIELTADGEIRWVEETWVAAEGADPDAEPRGCDSRLEIDGVLRFETADGAFAERFPVVIRGMSEANARLEEQRIDYAEMSGTYAPTDAAPADWDEVYVEWTVGVTANHVIGELLVGGYDHYPDEPDSHKDEWSLTAGRFPAP
jgi:hypothetical protein